MLRILVLAVLLSPMSIIGDVAGFFTGKIKDVAELVQKVWGALKHVLNYVTGIFRSVGTAWLDLHGSFRQLITGLESLAEGTYSAIRWLSATVVPKGVRQAINDAIGWAERNIKTIAKRAEQLVSDARAWAKKRIDSVLDYARKGIKHVTDAVNRALDFVKNRGNWLWDTVRHPAKLVTWILPSLVTPIMRYIRDHLQAVSTLVLRYAFSNLPKFALELERAVRSIF